MHVLSVNIDAAHTIANAKASTKTGIHKLPADAGAVKADIEQ
jgi:hypothetical protein